ncbi:MAG: hypothetical protein FJ025_00125 [Chloroflexi bacterium]|nr:hypothetical protein [Chloroflexota bacterium]
MRKKSIWIAISLIVVLGLLIGTVGCPKPAPTTAPPTTAPPTTAPPTTAPPTTAPPTTAPPTTPGEKPITILYHCPWPPGIILSDNEITWMDKVEQRTGGRIKFERIFGGSLSTLLDQAASIKDGVFDVGQVSYVYNPGLYPLGTVTILPAIEGDTRAWAYATHEMETTIPELIAEYTAMNQVYMFTWALEPMEFYSYVKITSLDGFKGLKIRVHGGSALAAQKLGWIGVSVPWEEIAVASANRVVDAACVPVPVTGRDAGLHTIYPYYIQLPVYQFHFATVMNLQKWNSIPADLQAIIIECNNEAVEDALDYLDSKIEQGKQDLIAEGVEFVEFPAAEKAKFAELAGAPVWADWVVSMNEKGLPGQRILDTFRALCAKYEQ